MSVLLKRHLWSLYSGCFVDALETSHVSEEGLLLLWRRFLCWVLFGMLPIAPRDGAGDAAEDGAGDGAEYGTGDGAEAVRGIGDEAIAG